MFDDQPLITLHDRFANKDWFHSVGKDQHGRLVVYVKYMCDETTSDIPRKIDGVNVLCHFASSKNLSKELFSHKEFQSKTISLPRVSMGVEDLGESDDVEETNTSLNLRELVDELDRLEKICGTNILSSIFFETHDKHNAVTNLSTKYPEVRKAMNALYQNYGFDIIYEELEM